MSGEKDVLPTARLHKSSGSVNFLYRDLEFRCSKALSGVDTIVGERSITSLGEIASQKHRWSAVPVRFDSMHQHDGSAGLMK
jgi:hypothetical protein